MRKIVIIGNMDNELVGWLQTSLGLDVEISFFDEDTFLSSIENEDFSNYVNLNYVIIVSSNPKFQTIYKMQQFPCPILFYSSKENSQEGSTNVFFIDNASDHTIRTRAFKSFLQSSKLKQDPNEKHAVGFDAFIQFCSKPTNVYITLPSGKFVNLGEFEPKGSNENILKYKERGISKIYLLTEDYSDYIGRIISNSIDSLSSGYSSEMDASKMRAFTTSKIRELAKNLGINQKVISHSEKLTETFIKSLEGQNNIKDILTNFTKSKSHYHNIAQLASYFCFMALEKLKSPNLGDYQNYVQASLFCDLSIENQDEIYPTKRSEILYLEEDVQQQVLYHPIKSSDLIDANIKGKELICELIENHQEIPDGSGYPEGKEDNQLSPNSSLFNLIYYFCSEFLKKGKFSKLAALKLLDEMYEVFGQGNSQEYYKTLQGILRDED